MSQWAAGPGKQGSNAWPMLLLLDLPSRCCLRRRQHGCTTLDHSLPRNSAQVRAWMKPFITFAAWWQWTFGTYWPQITGHSKWKLTATVTVAVGCAHVHSSSLTLKACKSEIRSSWAPSKRYHLASVRRLKPEWHMSNLLSSEGLGV